MHSELLTLMSISCVDVMCADTNMVHGMHYGVANLKSRLTKGGIGGMAPSPNQVTGRVMGIHTSNTVGGIDGQHI